MKLLLDQNLSRRIPSLIHDLFPASDHVRNLGLDRVTDEKVWSFARDHGFSIISKDSDFHQMSLLKGFPPKVIFLKVGNCSTELIISLLRSHADDIREFHDDAEASLLIMEG